MKRLAYLTVAAILIATPVLAQTTWQVDPAHSRAQFTVRHFMISNVRGDFGTLKGTVENFDGKDVTKARLSVTIDAASLTTRVQRRDDHLRSADFLDVENHPTLTFESTSITPAGGGKYTMNGNLTIRGTTRPVTFVLEPISQSIVDPQGRTRIGAEASGKINRRDFGVNFTQILDNNVIGVADEVLIQLDAELIRQDPAATN
jgi:polyisoprenoid-binding protein YceI